MFRNRGNTRQTYPVKSLTRRARKTIEDDGGREADLERVGIVTEEQRASSAASSPEEKECPCIAARVFITGGGGESPPASSPLEVLALRPRMEDFMHSILEHV